MLSSYKVIKGGFVSTNTVYTIDAPVIPVKVEKIERERENECVIDLEDVRMRAEAIIGEAKLKSSNILAAAKEDAEKLKKDAYDASYQKGYEEGKIKGREEGLRSVEALREEAKALLNEAHRASREYIENQKEEIIDLALCIAEKIIGYEADMKDSVILNIAARAIEEAVVRGNLIIRVNPEDYAILDCQRDELAKAAGEDTVINIIRDSGIKRGGCRIESEESFVDATVDAQLEKIKEALMGR